MCNQFILIQWAELLVGIAYVKFSAMSGMFSLSLFLEFHVDEELEVNHVKMKQFMLSKVPEQATAAVD